MAGSRPSSRSESIGSRPSSRRSTLAGSTRRNILVVGATGKQGGATVRALLAPGSPPDFHVWALTRNAVSPIAKALADDAASLDAMGRLHLLEGHLEDADGIRTIFNTVNATGRLWGVYVAIAFPGLGVKDDREKDWGIVRTGISPGQWHKQRDCGADKLSFTDARRFGPGVQGASLCLFKHPATVTRCDPYARVLAPGQEGDRKSLQGSDTGGSELDVSCVRCFFS